MPCFLPFYQTLYDHNRPDERCPSVTKAFLQHLQRERLAQASLVRTSATVQGLRTHSMGFERVPSKGGIVRDSKPVHRDAQLVRDAWLATRADEAAPLCITRTGRRLTRRAAAAIIQRMATQAHGRLSAEEQLDVALMSCAYFSAHTRRAQGLSLCP